LAGIFFARAPFGQPGHENAKTHPDLKNAKWPHPDVQAKILAPMESGRFTRFS
jgi:hypothetical protein